MARLKLSLPDDLPFAIELTVRVGDVNYGGHLGNDSLLGLLHEARVRFLDSLGYSELDVAGHGMIMGDVAIVYKAQAFLADCLRIEVGTMDFTGSGCDVVYRVNRVADGVVIALAKTGIALFD
ncbi:MAG: acyl-CoA thioesterase, partial [Victivallales bacterium]|nr:acyl-CoA thioesterase [Victivallales bacterium]